MVRFLASTALYLLANAFGLLAAAYLLDGFRLNAAGFVLSVIVLTTVNTVLGPFVLTMAVKYAPALRGGIALVTTFLGLLLAQLLTTGVRIEGLTTWLLAPFVVWVFVLIAAILLPLVLFKNVLADKRAPDARA